MSPTVWVIVATAVGFASSMVSPGILLIRRETLRMVRKEAEQRARIPAR